MRVNYCCNVDLVNKIHCEYRMPVSGVPGPLGTSINVKMALVRRSNEVMPQTSLERFRMFS